MKTNLKIFLCLFCLISGHSLTALKPIVKIGTEVFQTPVNLAMMHYNKYQWQVRSDHDIEKISSPAAYGVFAEFGFPAFSVFTRMGACNMAFNTESSYTSSLNGARTNNASSASLKQHQLLFGIGVKHTHQFNKIMLGLGVEVPLVYHSGGNLTETYSHKRYYQQSQQVNYAFSGINSYAMPSGLTGGLGALIELSFAPDRRLQAGMVLSAGIYRQIIDQTIEMNYMTSSTTYNQDGTLYSNAQGMESYILNSNLKHTFFSRVLPSFRLGYTLL